MIDCIAFACSRQNRPRIVIVIHQPAPAYTSSTLSTFLLHLLVLLLLPILIYLLFLFALSSFSFLSALALSALLWHPIYGPLPLAMTHACLALAPTPTSHPFILDPLPTFTFCVFDVFADISKQLSRHVSYRPEFPCHRALLVFGLRLRLCLGLISSH